MHDDIQYDDVEGDREYPSIKAAEAEQRRSRSRGCKCKPPSDPTSVAYDVRYYSELCALSYREYLRTWHWKQMRDRALEFARRRCQVCYSPRRLNVHHRTHERRGHELPSDLIVLCEGCHGLFHGRMA